VADGTTPLGQAYRAYEQVEGQLSSALDQLVATNGFADLLAASATNVMALTRLANGAVDRVVRSTRLAARHDVTELARQLARTEDKLERLLQAVEELQAQLSEAGQQSRESGTPSAPSAGTAPTPEAAARNGRASRARATAGASRQPAAHEEPS
jgi:ABC-type transporter Mla subunit MlaD